MASQPDRSVDRPAMPGSKTVVSYSEKIKFQIHWMIPNFSSLKAQTTPLYSDSVIVGTSAWRIKLIPLQSKQNYNRYTQKYDDSDATGLFLVRYSTDFTPAELAVEFKISVQNDSDTKPVSSFEYSHGAYYPYSEQKNCYGSSVFDHTDIWGTSPRLVLDDDILNIRATVPYLPVKTVSRVPKEEEVRPVDMGPLNKRFRNMFDSESGMKECKTGRYEMPDVSIDTLEAMLRFMYYNDMTHLKETARTVLVAADKYQVEDLKEVCEQILIEEIADDTAAGLLLLGDKVNGRTLKNAALRHVAVNLPKMTSAGQFTEIVEVGGKDLTKEVFEAVVRWGYKQV